MIERIDARRKADDWAGLVKQTEASFGEHGGKERLDDARADFQIRLLEEDPGMSAAVAEQALALFDHMSKRAQRGDLNAVLDQMRETCEIAQAGMALECDEGGLPESRGVAAGRRSALRIEQRRSGARG